MLQQFFTALGFGLCHQLPERSFFGGGVQLPVCARDTGIYIGYAFAFLLVLLLHRGERPSRFPSAVGWIALVALVALMLWDGVTSYASLRATNNLIRLLTGTAAGYAVAAVVVPLLNSELWASSDEVNVLTPPWRLGAWLLTLPIVVAAVWFGGPALGVGYPFLVTGAILFTFVTVNMAFAALLPAYDRSARSWRDLAVPVAIGFVLTLVELAGAAMIRIALDAWARSLG